MEIEGYAFWVLVVILLLIVIQLVRLAFADADLTLLWKEKYGLNVEQLAGKVVWITGASSGIGEYLAYNLAKAGCKLVLSARRSEELERVKKQCLTNGRITTDDILVLPLDMLAFNTHDGATKQVLDHFKTIDILVNNAGRSQRAWAKDTDIEVQRQIVELNLLGPISLTKAVLPHFIEKKRGHLVVTSSIAGKLGAPFSAGYCASKFALHGWYDALRMEMVLNNISVTLVCPGPVFSDITRTAFTERPDQGWYDTLRLEMTGHNIGVTLVCPGAVFSNIRQYEFTSQTGQMYGNPMKSDEKRITTDRCAALMAIAIVNKLDEVWIALNPVLFFTYLSQYCPDFARMVAKRAGMKIVMKIREGKL